MPSPFSLDPSRIYSAAKLGLFAGSFGGIFKVGRKFRSAPSSFKITLALDDDALVVLHVAVFGCAGFDVLHRLFVRFVAVEGIAGVYGRARPA